MIPFYPRPLLVQFNLCFSGSYTSDEVSAREFQCGSRATNLETWSSKNSSSSQVNRRFDPVPVHFTKAYPRPILRLQKLDLFMQVLERRSVYNWQAITIFESVSYPLLDQDTESMSKVLRGGPVVQRIGVSISSFICLSVTPFKRNNVAQQLGEHAQKLRASDNILRKKTYLIIT